MPDGSIYSLQSDDVPSFRTPEWAKDAIWYQVMVDRFRNGNPANDPDPVRPWRSRWYEASDWEGTDGQTFYEYYVFSRLYGGDLQGLGDRLDYLRDLGVNALYLNPIFQSPSHHKYDTTSYVHVDEHYGTSGDSAVGASTEDLLDASTWSMTGSDEVFLGFLKEAKARGFRVIIDGVFNHVGTSHPAFVDVLEHGRDSRYADWFDITSWEPFEYEGWAGFKELPAFRKDDEHGIASESARRHLFEITRRWMDPDGDGDPSDGIDGWRLDVPSDVPMPFWHEWCEYVRSINPEAYITGEIWEPAEQWLDGRSFDAVMNYPFAKIALEWIGNQAHRITASEADRRFAELRLAYDPEITYVQQNLVDSHDTDRLVSKIKNPDREYDRGNREQDDPTYDGSKPGPEHYRRARLVALLQMTSVGAPMIYYGDEAGMWGADDPTNRKPMLWKDLEPYENPADNFVMDEHLDFYRRAIALRNDHPALRRGTMRTLLVDDEQDTWVFVRALDGEVVLVALNASEREGRVTIPRELLPDGAWSLVFGGGRAAVESPPHLVLPPLAGRAWTLDQ
ncbi:MAG: glycoside hydrolase family 13 protein [Phycisphaerales bacterium]|nr:glycoside hydrolase family 13 protein [Phycisphaerales bacterium]